jgi:hypothetical protein
MPLGRVLNWSDIGLNLIGHHAGMVVSDLGSSALKLSASAVWLPYISVVAGQKAREFADWRVRAALGRR